jgi:hypothetical protein
MQINRPPDIGTRALKPRNDGKYLGTACATSMHDLVEGDGMSKDADEAW